MRDQSAISGSARGGRAAGAIDRAEPGAAGQACAVSVRAGQIQGRRPDADAESASPAAARGGMSGAARGGEAIHDPREDGFAIVESRVVRVHVHSDLVVPDTQHVDTSRWQPLFYVFRHYFGLGPDLGRNFRAER
jgi:hypothetical protein